MHLIQVTIPYCTVAYPTRVPPTLPHTSTYCMCQVCCREFRSEGEKNMHLIQVTIPCHTLLSHGIPYLGTPHPTPHLHPSHVPSLRPWIPLRGGEKHASYTGNYTMPYPTRVPPSYVIPNPGTPHPSPHLYPSDLSSLRSWIPLRGGEKHASYTGNYTMAYPTVLTSKPPTYPIHVSNR